MNMIMVPILLGWFAAFFVNYMADVLPYTRNFTKPVCLQCQEPISLRSYFLMQGASGCGHHHSLRTWVTQALGVAAALYVWFNPPLKLGFALGLILLIYLAVVLIIDIEHRLILHPTSLFGAALALILGTLLHGIAPTLIGGLAGFGIMFLLYLFGIQFTRVRAKKMTAKGIEQDEEEALGFGDVNLAGILGLLLGWPVIWFGLLLGILAGGAISLLIVIYMLIARKYKDDAFMVFIPYGPYFILSSFALIYLPTWIKTIIQP